MVAGWPPVEMTGKQEHIVHHHIFITVLNLMMLTVLEEIALIQKNIHHDHYRS